MERSTFQVPGKEVSSSLIKRKQIRVALGVLPLEPDLPKAPTTLTTTPNPEITLGSKVPLLLLCLQECTPVLALVSNSVCLKSQEMPGSPVWSHWSATIHPLVLQA